MVAFLKGQDSTLTAGKIFIKCGIFKGDTLSLLLFCLNPLSTKLSQTDCSYYIGKGRHADHHINHLLYTDDLKLYASSEQQLKSLFNAISIFSKDTFMKSETLVKLSVHHGFLTLLGDIATTNEKFQEPMVPDATQGAQIVKAKERTL